MNFKQEQLDGFIKNPDSKVKCLILFGTNEGAIAEWQKKCAESVCSSVEDAFRYAQIDMANVSKDGREIYAEFCAQSLMGGRRAIVVKNAENSLAAFVKNLIEQTTSDNLLILSSLSMNTRSSLITWAKDRDDAIVVGCYEDRSEDMAGVALAMLKEKGLSVADQSVLQVLCARLSPDRKLSRSEIEKLSVYMGERKNVTIDDVRAVISDASGASFEDLCYAVAGGNADLAIRLYQRLLGEGEDPATIVRQLEYHFNKLLECAAWMEDGKSLESAVSSLRPPLMFYRKNAFMQQLKCWRKDHLLGALKILYECEKDCKTTNYPTEQGLEFALLRLCMAAQKIRKN